jgi:hypothetical protein
MPGYQNLRTPSAHATPENMGEAAITKVFATPAAYEFLTNRAASDEMKQKIIKHLLEAADGGRIIHFKDGTTSRLKWDNFSAHKWPVAVLTREEKTEHGLIRTVLLCSIEGEHSEDSIYDGGDEAFYSAVAISAEIPFV